MTGVFIPSDPSKAASLLVYNEELDGTTLQWMQRAVGGWIECVRLGGHRRQDKQRVQVDLWINEEGKLEGLPYNERATALAAHLIPGDYIAGDALVLCSDEEGESIGLTMHEATLLLASLEAR